jgi:MoxR-like ATPase
MKIPEVTSTALQEAMDRFDNELRSTPSWVQWQDDDNYKYAIERDGQLYPVKKVVSLATGIPVAEFGGGNQANSYVEGRGFKVVELRSHVTQAWIFQANPNIYDVRGAVRKLSKLTWTVTRHRDDIHPGDRVYLWESGSEGGIVAMGEVLADLQGGPTLEEEAPFVKQPDKLEPETPRVQLGIRGVVEPILGRAEIASRSELSNLRILRQPQGTNFAVEKREAEVLDDLLKGRIKEMQSPIDLTSAEVLRRLYDEFQRVDGTYTDWWNNLTTFQEMIARASQADRASPKFQQQLWDENPVSNVEQGFISVNKAIEDENLRKWIASKSLERLPENPNEATARLAEFGDAMVEHLRPYCRQIPYLKIFRVLAALFPHHFTTITDRGKLKDLHVAMLGSTGAPWPPNFETSASHAVKRHANVLARLTEVLGPTSGDVSGLVRRITFPWFLYEKLQQQPASGAKTAPEADSLPALAESLLIESDYLTRVITLLKKKRQLIFYGPPGTGKTFVARRLGQFLAGDDKRIEMAQFHPSYAYEDFIEGYRPSISDGRPGFKLQDGALKRIAAKAWRDPDETHVLIIDEVNRGNLAKVFGELYYLLEYRDEKISLLYSQESFILPKNLFIIATMNTADRSIALIDAALRRRFYFVPFFPDEPPVEGLLRRWLQKNKPDLLWVADVVELANRKLGDRHVAIGPSYFMDVELTEDWVSLIWKHSIIPYLEEHFFGEDRLGDFEIARLREAIDTK